MSQEPEMSVRGKIVEILRKDTFKVETEFGFAYVWVYEEIQVEFRVGDDFLVDDAPVTFSQGYPQATLRTDTMFFLNDLRYNIVDMSGEAVSARIQQDKSGTDS